MTRAGHWPSPLDAAAVAAGGKRLAQPSVRGEHAYWLEGRPADGGRVALMRADRSGSIEQLSPPVASVKSRVHEYGGGAYLACDAGTFYSDDASSQLHRVLEPGRAEPLTRSPGLRFADLAHDPKRSRLVAVCEDAREDAHRPRHSLVAIGLHDGAVTTLVAGRGFYASPRVSPDGAMLAFLAWDLPAMPWDGAELFTLDLGRAAAYERCVCRTPAGLGA